MRKEKRGTRERNKGDENQTGGKKIQEKGKMKDKKIRNRD